MLDPVFIGEQRHEVGPLIGGPVPDHVVPPMPRPDIVVGASHRITQHLLARRQAERHDRKDIAVHIGRHRGFRDQRAPGHIPGIERLALGRAQSPYGRADSVGADQDIAGHPLAIGKNRGHAVAVLLDRLQRTAAMVMRGRKSIAQDPVHPLPGGHDLRAIQFERHPPVRVEQAPLLHRHAKGVAFEHPDRAARPEFPAAPRCPRRGRTIRLRPSRRYRPATRQPAASGPQTARSSSHR